MCPDIPPTWELERDARGHSGTKLNFSSCSVLDFGACRIDDATRTCPRVSQHLSRGLSPLLRDKTEARGLQGKLKKEEDRKIFLRAATLA